MTTHPSKTRVLFLCTANSARSQMAEAILRHEASDQFEVFSAGTDPRPINPVAIEVLKEAGISTASLTSKGTADFLGRIPVQVAIIVCDKAHEKCPNIFPFTLTTLYWPFDDPAAYEGSDDEKRIKFRQVRDEIRHRIIRWLASNPFPAQPQ